MALSCASPSMISVFVEDVEWTNELQDFGHGVRSYGAVPAGAQSVSQPPVPRGSLSCSLPVMDEGYA